MQDWVELALLRARSRRVEVVERVDIMLESEESGECEWRGESVRGERSRHAL